MRACGGGRARACACVWVRAWACVRVRARACARVRARACARVRARACARVRARVCACVCVLACVCLRGCLRVRAGMRVRARVYACVRVLNYKALNYLHLHGLTSSCPYSLKKAFKVSKRKWWIRYRRETISKKKFKKYPKVRSPLLSFFFKSIVLVSKSFQTGSTWPIRLF